MNIQYFAPLSRAWNRMKKILFQPFDLGKWFALGFSAFLAGLLDYHGGGEKRSSGGHFDLHDFFSLPDQAREWLDANPDWFSLILIIIVAVILLILLLTWLSSRGKFMFLDNVIHNRSNIAKPWTEFRKLGDSLFFWRLGYGVVIAFIFSSYIWFCYTSLGDMYNQFASDYEMIKSAIWMGLLLVAMGIITAYISLFLNDFVVPIMYKRNQRATVAWGHFLALSSQHKIVFFKYGLFVLFIFILVMIVIVIFGLVTCCIGFILLAIPYINVVILLPVPVWFRGFSVEFLEQFGEDYKFFPDEVAGTESPVA